MLALFARFFIEFFLLLFLFLKYLCFASLSPAPVNGPSAAIKDRNTTSLRSMFLARFSVKLRGTAVAAQDGEGWQLVQSWG